MFAAGAAALVVALLAVAPARAADYTLTGGANGAAASDTSISGSSMNASSAFWVPSDYSSLTRVPWPNTTSDTMVFGVGTGTAGDVQTTGTFNLNGMRFQTTGSGTYRIYLNTTTFALGGTDPTITVNSGVTARISNNGGSGSTGLLTAPSGSTVRFTGGGTLYMDSMAEFNNAGSGAGFTSLGRGTSRANNNYSVVQDGNTTVRYTGAGGIALSTDGSGSTNLGTGTTTYTLKSGVLRHDGSGESYLVIGRNWKADFVQEGGEVILLNTGNAVFIGDRGAGSYTISGGTLSAVTSAANFQMSFRSTNASSLSISGSGSFRSNGTGTLAVTSGATSTVAISGGELAVNALAKGAGTVSFSFSGGTLRPYAADSTFGSTTAGNNFTISLSGTGATFSGLDAAAGTSRTATVEALLSGTGRVNINGGRVAFGNASNSYTGWTVISAGTLAPDADATLGTSSRVVVGSAGSSGAVLDLTAKSGSFTFASGQTVAGIGTLNIGSGKTIVSNGVWAPGNSIGSNTITGNLQLSGTSEFELGTPGSSTSSPGTSDFTAVSGTLTLGGALNLVDNAGAGGQGSAAGGVYRLYTYGAVSGSYASVTAPNASTRAETSSVTLGGSGTAAGQGVFVTVWNKAAASTLSGTINLGTVLAGSPLSTALTISNTAPATFSETLDASFGTVTSATSGGSITGLAAGGSSSVLTVGFATASAGARSGTATVNFFTSGTSGSVTSGFASLALDSQTVSLMGTVLDPATASFASGSTATSLLVDIGSFTQNTGTHSTTFNIYNLLQTADYTADLALQSFSLVSGTSLLSTNLATFASLASGTFNTWSADLDSSTVGTFSNVYTLSFRSSTSGTAFSDTPQELTLTLQGTIVAAVPEPGTFVLAGMGLAGLALWRRRRA